MGLKEKYAYKRIYKEASLVNRKPVIPHLSGVIKIGVLWQPTQKDAFRYLNSHFSKYQVIFRGFCVFEESVDPQPDANSITSKQINWWGLPKKETTNDFTKTDFDILFNVALKQNMVLDYLTATSLAKFKIGCSPNENNFFDLNINIGEKQDALYLVKQQIFYLGQLNKNTSK